MTSATHRVNYDLIAHLYDEPGRDYDIDPHLVQFLSERTNPPGSRIRILDMGCGTGKQLTANHQKFPEMQMVGLDRFHGMLEQAKKRCALVHWLQGDSANPSFDDCSFNYITNQFSYHHVQDKIGLITATYRILKPKGRFIITNLDPWAMPEWIVYRYFPSARQRDLSDFLPVEKLTALMQQTGFYHIRVKYQHSHREENLNDFLKYASQRHRTSQLMAIQDHEYEAGVATLKAHIAELGIDSHISSEICLVWIKGDKPG